MYQAKSFDWESLTENLIKVVNKTVGLPCVYENSKLDQPAKPFVTFSMINDHTSMDYQVTRDNEAFMTTITLKAKADSMLEAVSIKDDLRTLLQSWQGRDDLKNHGIVLASNPIQNERSVDDNDIPFMQDAEAGFDLVIELQRHYQANYYALKQVKNGKEDLNG